MDGQRGQRTALARTPSRSGHDLFSDVSDFSDVSFQDSKMEEIRSSGISRHLSMTPGPSRFLQRSQTRVGKHLLKESPILGGRPHQSSGAPQTPASRVRAAAALTRLAQIESRILSRRARVDSPPSEAGARTSGDSLPEGAGGNPRGGTGAGPPRSADSASPEHAQELPAPESSGWCRAGRRFLKEKEPPTARAGKGRNLPIPKQKGPTRTFKSLDSDEEEMKVLLGSLMESPRDKENQGFTSTKVSEREQTKRFLEDDPVPAQPSVRSPPDEALSRLRLCRTPHPPTPLSAGRTLRGAGSRTPSPPTRGPGGSAPSPGTCSRSAPSTRGHATPASSPQRSGAVPRGAEASEDASDSLDDFRVNVFSLDELPPAARENPDLDQQEESTQRGTPSRPRSQGEAPAGLGAPGQAQGRSVAVTAQATSAGEGRPPSESEVSELPSERPAPSSQRSASSRTLTTGDSTAGTVSSVYSEDFEGSPSPTVSEPAGRSQASADGSPGASADFSSSLERDTFPQPPQPSRNGVQAAPRVVVKEKAVQTPDPASSYLWARAFGPALGGAYVDPTPLASHVVSADTLEALTAYSPAAFALNDLLRQQLSLTQQFLEASRQLHGSVLRALDEDSFHSHTLEEAKEYIKHHKPVPLTLEDALEQVQEEP